MTRSTVIRRVLVICLAAAVMAGVAGCATSADKPTGAKSADAEPAYIGPFPQGTGVALGEWKVTLDAVEVSDFEWPYQDTSTAPPKGRKWVYVDFAFEGPGANPSPGGGRFYPQYQLLADGRPIEINVMSTGGDAEAPPGVVPHEQLTFQVPDDVRSLVLLARPKTQSSDEQVIGFRLW